MKLLRIFAGVFLIAALVELPQLASETTAVTSFVANTLFQNNFHEVVPGTLYRSGELSANELREVAAKYNIRTVIDLRLGSGQPDAQGIVERDAAQSLGIDYHALPLTGSRVPDSKKLQELVDLYDRVESPVLVHCSSGTHRSGVASAVWLLTKGGGDIERSNDQLSPRYGFFRKERDLKSFLQGYPTIDNLIWDFERDNAQSHITFREWLEKRANSEQSASGGAGEAS